MPTQPRPVSFKLLEQLKRDRVSPQLRGMVSLIIFLLKEIRVIAVLKSNRKNIVPGLITESREVWTSAESQLHVHSAAYIRSSLPTIARIGAEHPADRRTLIACSKVDLNEAKTGGYRHAPVGSFSMLWVLWQVADASISFRRPLRNGHLVVRDIDEDILADHGSDGETEMILPLGHVWVNPHITQNRGGCIKVRVSKLQFHGTDLPS